MFATKNYGCPKLGTAAKKSVLTGAGAATVAVVSTADATCTAVVRCTAGIASVLHCGNSSGSKFVNGERHSAECVTGRTGVIAGAFLIGNAEFNCINEILLGTLDADYREEAKGYRKVSASLVAQIAEHSAKCRGNIPTAAATAALRGSIYHTRAEDYGVDCLNYRDGKIVPTLTAYWSGAEAVAESV